ncbi:MAG: hypothetical protein ACI4I1_04930 [Oscillospiraceae bacterium]
MSIRFHLPSFTQHYCLNKLMIEYLREHPEYFIDGLEIASVFGSFDGSTWNGGRVVGGSFDPKLTKLVIKTFDELKVPLRFTFTNPMITEEHLSDKNCNEILKMADNGINQVIVMSDMLENYIRENYPNYKITSSTCKEIRDMDGVNAELEKPYNLVVLDYNWNNRFDELEKIKDKARCEILVNALCQPNCPRRGEHYKAIGKIQIDRCNAGYAAVGGNLGFKDFECPFMSRKIYDITELSTFISPETIAEKYVPMGFSEFKLEGRSAADIEMLETYIYYFTKPETRDKVRLEMLTKLTGRIKNFNFI